MLTQNGQVARSSQQDRGLPPLARLVSDYNSCWSALPDLLRARVEPLLEARSALEPHSNRHSTSIGSGACRA